MLKHPFKPALFVSLLALGGVPAAAEVHVDLPGVEIRVGHHAPPAVRHEHRPPRPASNYVWVPGAWDWQGNDWAWMGGRWERPAYDKAKWVTPRYQREGEAWRYEPGHWNQQKVVEGDDYRRWKSEQGGRDNKGNKGHGHDKEKKNDHDR